MTIEIVILKQKIKNRNSYYYFANNFEYRSKHSGIEKLNISGEENLQRLASRLIEALKEKFPVYSFEILFFQRHNYSIFF